MFGMSLACVESIPALPPAWRRTGKICRLACMVKRMTAAGTKIVRAGAQGR
jgi:hypothetical protein